MGTKEEENIMIVHIPTNTTFPDRKTAKKVMGQLRYREALKAGDILVHGLNQDYVDKVKSLKEKEDNK